MEKALLMKKAHPLKKVILLKRNSSNREGSSVAKGFFSCREPIYWRKYDILIGLAFR